MPRDNHASGGETGHSGVSPSSPNRTGLHISDNDLAHFFKDLLEQNPSSPLFVIMAESLCSRELWSEAVEIIRRGLEFHPRHFRGRVLLGWALWKLGMGKEAERALAEVRAELEENAIIYKVLAEMADSEGDSAQAWRLMHIYQSLQDDIPKPKQKQPETTKQLTPEPDQAQETFAVKFLSSLLSEFERRPARAIPQLHVFTDDDRKQLNEILDIGTS